MAPTIPAGEPSSVRAGDSWVFKQSFPEYPVSEGWTLAYAFAGRGELATLAAEITNDGASTYTVTIPAARTSIPVGLYQWAATMTGSGSYAGQRYTVRTGTIEVTADVAAAESEDLELPEEKLLRAIDAVIYGRVTDDVQEVTIGGRSIVKIPVLELFAIKSRLERKVYTKRTGSGMAVSRVAFTC